MNLSEFERHHALWKKISDHLSDQIAVLRAKNDGEWDAVETARLRGKISAYKELLALGDPGPSEVADEH